MKKVPVVAVLLDAQNNACGFSRALTEKQLNGIEAIPVKCFELVSLQTARVEFAVPGGVIAVSNITKNNKIAFPGYTVLVFRSPI